MLAFLSKIGSFLAGLFQSTEHAYDKLEPAIKNAMEHASGVVAVINANLNVAPSFVIDAITKHFPEMDLASMHAGLLNVARILAIGTDLSEQSTLEEVVSKLQGYLGSLKGTTWANVCNTIAEGIAICLAPPGTKFALISIFMEHVFQRFIKPKVYVATEQPATAS